MIHFPSLKALALTTACTLSALTLTACGNFINGDHVGSSMQTIDAHSLANDPAVSPKEKAENLALAAEKLVLVDGFIYADQILDLALNLDSQNVRARLFKALLAPTMELKGLMNRVAPLAEQRPDNFPQYLESVEQFKKTPEQTYARFLMQGPQDIHTERDAQELIARFTMRLDELRLTLKALKHEDLRIHVQSPEAKQQGLNDAVAKCVIQQPRPNVYEAFDCDFSHAYEVALNEADFEAAAQTVAASQVYLTLLNAYDLTGLYRKSASLDKMSNPKAINWLFAEKNFGTLRQNNAFGAIPSLAKDYILALREAAKNQSTLCPATEFASRVRRPGQLFRDGLCVEMDSVIDAQMRAFEYMLNGTPTIFNFPMGDKSLPALVNLKGFFDTPVQDARTLMPITLNQCGTAKTLGDGKLGGLFPNGDLNYLLTESSRLSCPFDQLGY